ncbi:MAG: histidine kinase dimerization/phospho-acceptor domain-containing protein [Thermodesulfovibrionales bacterium]|jgi:signal transduction histidine kinase
MNHDKGKHLAEVIKNLSENLVGDDFELIMLRGLSHLFRASSVAFMSRKKDGGEDFIRVVELREDMEREDMLSEADFARRYGFSFSDAIAGHPPPGEGLSETPRTMVISFMTGKYHSLIHMTSINDTEYLSDERIVLLQPLIELALNARYSIKNVTGFMHPDSQGIGFWGHRIKTTLSSIRTAVDMFMDQDLSEDDTEELKNLVRKGVIELSEIVDTLLQVSRLNNGNKS